MDSKVEIFSFFSVILTVTMMMKSFISKNSIKLCLYVFNSNSNMQMTADDILQLNEWTEFYVWCIFLWNKESNNMHTVKHTQYWYETKWQRQQQKLINFDFQTTSNTTNQSMVNFFCFFGLWINNFDFIKSHLHGEREKNTFDLIKFSLSVDSN